MLILASLSAVTRLVRVEKKQKGTTSDAVIFILAW